MSKIVIEGGQVRSIYSDEQLPYIEALRAEFGLPAEALQIRRATRVEPDPVHTAGGNWFVDLSPMNGPVCYQDEQGTPFQKRQEAIDFELRWLDANWLTKEPNHVGSITEEE